MNRGVVYALAAYLLWGAFPAYFKAVHEVAPLEVLAHRMLWSLAFVAVLLLALRRGAWLAPVLREPRLLARFGASAALVSVNWLIYIWSVNHDRVVDASLGYFINPLVNVLIAALFLGERLRRVQWLAVAIAGAGVLWLTWQAGGLPWIGLALAVTFALYGLMRRQAPLGALEGFALETALLAPLALAYLGWLAAQGANAFVDAVHDGRPALALLLVLAGPVTAVPLLFFTAGARRISFATLGLLQYAAPTLQLLLGVFLYGETLDGAKLAGYAAVWLALAVFSVDALAQAWRGRRADPPPR